MFDNRKMLPGKLTTRKKSKKLTTLEIWNLCAEKTIVSQPIKQLKKKRFSISQFKLLIFPLQQKNIRKSTVLSPIQLLIA